MLPELYIYRKLIKSLTDIKGFNGWFIAKLELKMEKTLLADNKAPEKHVKNGFIKQRKNCSVVSACTIYGNIIYILTMYLIKPARMPGVNIAERYTQLFTGKNTFINCNFTYLFKLVYTAECIKEFTEDTGDSNIIHQKAQPVVPGFLMFEDIITKNFYKDTSGNNKSRYIMVFKNPVIAGEEIEIYNLGSTNGKIIALQAESLKSPCKTVNIKWEFCIL